jgi:hypothetical protein
MLEFLFIFALVFNTFLNIYLVWSMQKQIDSIRVDLKIISDICRIQTDSLKMIKRYMDIRQ